MAKSELDKLKEKLKSAKTNTMKEVLKKKIESLKLDDLKNKKGFSFLKGMSKAEIKRDQKRTAKPKGWRFVGRDKMRKPTPAEVKAGKKNGTVYYEARNRRSDQSRIVKLEKGGTIDIGSNVRVKDKKDVTYGATGKIVDFTSGRAVVTFTSVPKNSGLSVGDSDLFQTRHLELLPSKKSKGGSLFDGEKHRTEK